MDKLYNYFSMKMVEHGLLDIEPSKLFPTWSNKRVGHDRIFKILDIILIFEELMEKHFRFRQWVGQGGESNYYLVMLLVKKGEKIPHCPFKFNAKWLKDESFVSLLKDTWKDYEENSLVSPSINFFEYLKKIKEVSIQWYVLTLRLQQSSCGPDRV